MYKVAGWKKNPATFFYVPKALPANTNLRLSHTNFSLAATNLYFRETNFSLAATNLYFGDTNFSLAATNLYFRDTNFSLAATNLYLEETNFSLGYTNCPPGVSLRLVLYFLVFGENPTGTNALWISNN
jgi:hypothetical protein